MVQIGDRIEFFPSHRSATRDGKDGPVIRQKTEGKVIYINQRHRYCTLEYSIPPRRDLLSRYSRPITNIPGRTPDGGYKLRESFKLTPEGAPAFNPWEVATEWR